jgi:GNAT superfamily N-acetyltransferase
MTGQPDWLIRPLTLDDLPAFRPVRLAALRDHPEAYGASYEEELQGGPNNDIGRLIVSPPGVTLGAFVADRLVGTVCLSVTSRVKTRHKGHLSAVYIVPEWRGTGLARELLAGVIDHARSIGLIALTLSVTVGNETARHLYLRAGFRSYGVEPRSLLIGATLWDEELMVLTLG